MSFDVPVEEKKIVSNKYLSQEPGQSIQASGTSGVSHYAEDWMIEKQKMDIHYIRVPNYSFVGAFSSTLSATNYTFSTQRTVLQTNVVASYSREKVNAAFDSSGYVQPQTFMLAALSGDANGMTYGPPSEFTPSTMGCAGSILTDYEFYHRRKWNEGVDTEINEFCDGYNFMCVSAYCQGADAQSFNQLEYWGMFNNTPNVSLAGTKWDIGQAGGSVRCWGSVNYPIVGPYKYNKETNLMLTNFIDYCGITQTSLVFPRFVPAPAILNNSGCVDKAYNEGCLGYDSSRHLY